MTESRQPMASVAFSADTEAMRLALVIALGLLGCRDSSGRKTAAPQPRSPLLTHGIAAGEVTATSAMLWARFDSDAVASFACIASDGARIVSPPVAVTSKTDHVAQGTCSGLQPATTYRYEVRIGDAKSSPLADGSLTTAPAADDSRAVRFVWSGDLGGQNACRDATRGYPIIKPMAAAQPHFFIALGDMIYADGVCQEKGRYGNKQVAGHFGQAATLESFRAHWRYNRADLGFQRFLAAVPTFAVWDDHEVVNDFGPSHDTRDVAPYTANTPLTPIGRRAFVEYNVIPASLYRNVRWGKHLELLFLDTRSYRDANSALDNRERPKTMLGAEQLAWLRELLSNSDATWKVIISSVPIAIPTGSGPPNVSRDGWAGFGSGQGFERELGSILETAARARAKLLWLTTDVHFASVISYHPVLAGKAFNFTEAVVGPMSAGLYPSQDLDDSFAPKRMFFHGPADPGALAFDEALGYMTFGEIEVAVDGTLTLRVVDANSRELFKTTLR